MAKGIVILWRCMICGDGYIGGNPPDACPFCGAHKNYIVEAKKAKVSFDVFLNDKDKANAGHALKVEVSNAAFYFCAADKTNDPEGKILFKALGKIEAEHAVIWRKILKMDTAPRGNELCNTENKANLEESHIRESMAIELYKKAAAESENPRIKQLFTALVEIEADHLALSEERLGN